ncbi:8c653c68-7b3a-4870-b09b-57c95e3f3990 [Sclerotinia trifoliorum]|uniref:Elongation factor 1 alpha-like protein n=1 Tax=Sclerotinia trifoliorum TaxID=28548 RepID=A0A8H2W4J7_9HELO|nr:8c653c68-7b3a-4870-b09b-57c95e3f3990 [Sclerotinia trifoliorum]
MSRHKNVRNLDLDDELDDFDGGDDYGYEEEEAAEGLSEEDQEQMRQGTIKVREALPSGTSKITEKQIQEALWHYYYDVEKSVKYLVNTYLPKVPKKVAGNKSSECYIGVSSSQTYTTTSSAKNFFANIPWFNLPPERVAIFTPPSQHPGGLLGGSSEGTPKMSKLQALAAARRKKAQDQQSLVSEVEKPMANLSLNKTGDDSATELHDNKSISSSGDSLSKDAKHGGSPFRKRKDSNPHEKVLKPQPTSRNHQTKIVPPVESSPVYQASPSAFASTMFQTASVTPRPRPENNFTMPYTSEVLNTPANPFAGPSPDDVVIAAQSKAGGKERKGTSKESPKESRGSNGVDSSKVDDVPRATSKNLDVLAEFEKTKSKNAANFVVIGHVDAGKSTLMGRLLYDLKVVDQRTIDRYRKEAEKMGKSSFALAWVLDQGTEERSRGVTIDIAMNKFETEKTVFTILDAPGHRDFIPNMIAGASQADFAVLVIDASTGSFESGLKGQTKEHALLVRSMGVQRIIITVNKLDTVTWSRERFDEISQQVSAFLMAAGFQEKNIKFIPCSGLNGDNIVRKSTEQDAAWYTGPTLVEELDNSEPVARALNKPLRLTIGDVFRGGVQNPLSISGRIEAGSLQVGDPVLAQPSNQKCFVKGLEVDNETVDWAVAGQNITMHLSDIDPIHLKIGDVLCLPSQPISNIKIFTAKVLAFEFLTPMHVDVHRGRLHTAGKIKEIVAVLDKGTGQPIGKKKPRIIKPAQVARVVVELETSVPLEAPTRVILRSDGVTVAAGLLE